MFRFFEERDANEEGRRKEAKRGVGEMMMFVYGSFRGFMLLACRVFILSFFVSGLLL